jgi:hypothetical protein
MRNSTENGIRIKKNGFGLTTLLKAMKHPEGKKVGVDLI